MRRLLIALVVALSVIKPAHGQDGATLRLSSSTGRLDAEFSQITSIRELADGRILITDGREQRVLIGDFTSRSTSAVGRNGSGPEEYQGTTLLFPLAGDSSVMLDPSRKWILFHGSRIVGTVPADAPAAREVRGFIQGADSLGHIVVYRSPPNSRPQTEAQDSVRVLMIDRTAGRADDVAALRAVPSVTRTMAMGGGSMTYRTFTPYATGETARLFPDGWIAIVRLEPYRVDWRTPDGRLITGQPLPYKQHQVTEVDRTAFRDAHPVRQGRPPLFDFDAFPQHLPPYEYFAPGDPALFGAANGSLVIRRTVAGSLATNDYDVVDRSGRLVGTLRLPKRERVAGFGARAVYVVARDDDDVEHIRRHPWP